MPCPTAAGSAPGSEAREAGWLTGGMWRALGRLLVSAACSDGRSSLCGGTVAEVPTARLGDAPLIEALVRIRLGSGAASGPMCGSSCLQGRLALVPAMHHGARL